MLFLNPIYAENDAKLFLVIGPFLGSHYRFQSRLPLTLPGVLKNLSTFSHFVCELSRTTLANRFKQNCVNGISLAVARLSKSLNFSLSSTAGNPVTGKIGFWLVAKQK